MSHPRKLLKDGLTIGDQFRLVEQLGQGGMGTVWSAEDLRLGRPVAIKFLSHELLNDQQARNRFAREPRLASKIRSPHVVQVYAQGTTEDDVPYLVMELLEGEDLASRIAREGPCSLAEAGSIVEQVCRALGRAHREGLVHRDIKPHNIFLSSEGDGQVFVKLLDFGIAKDVGSRITALTLTGEVVGSALYVSPEQLHEAASVGPSADIWSLGIVIYELISGRVPFEGRSLPELFMRIVEGQYTPVSQLGRGLPAVLDGFFQQIIQRDPTQRFQTVDELAAAFARIVRANSSGLLLKPETPRSLPAAQYVQPAPEPVSSPKAQAGEPTERMPKPSPRAILLCVAALAIVLTAYLLRMRPPEGAPQAVQPAVAEPQVPLEPARPVAKAAAVPSQPVGAQAAPPPAAEVSASPRPTAAEDLPSGVSPEADTSRKPKPKAAAAPVVPAPRSTSNSASSSQMPRNHGF